MTCERCRKLFKKLDIPEPLPFADPIRHGAGACKFWSDGRLFVISDDGVYELDHAELERQRKAWLSPKRLEFKMPAPAADAWWDTNLLFSWRIR